MADLAARPGGGIKAGLRVFATDEADGTVQQDSEVPVTPRAKVTPVHKTAWIVFLHRLRGGVP